jgi:hypothetical protein
MENDFQSIAALAKKMHIEQQQKMNECLESLNKNKSESNEKKQIVNSLVDRINKAAAKGDKKALQGMIEEVYSLQNSL